MVNPYNKTMLAALCYNMNIHFIGLDSSAKVALYYISDYITKMQLKVHITHMTLEAAVWKVDDFNSYVDNLVVRVKVML